jgi:hypothetical protein
MLRKIPLVFAVSVFASTAFGSGWDWDVAEVNDNSSWDTLTLDWAAEAHPNNPSHAFLEANIPPPPREMWCIDSTWGENCDDWSHHMDWWLHAYLHIPLSKPLPSGLPDYPEECASSCDDIW